jgi:hypothetical protein
MLQRFIFWCVHRLGKLLRNAHARMVGRLLDLPRVTAAAPMGDFSMKVGLPLFAALLAASSASAAGAPACGKYSAWQGSIESGGKQIGDSVTADFEHGSYSAHDMTIPAMAGGDIADVKCTGSTLQFTITNMHPLTTKETCSLSVQDTAKSTGSCTDQTGKKEDWSGKLQLAAKKK